MSLCFQKGKGHSLGEEKKIRLKSFWPMLYGQSVCVPQIGIFTTKQLQSTLPSPPTPSPLGVGISAWQIQGTQACCPDSTGQIPRRKCPDFLLLLLLQAVPCPPLTLWIDTSSTSCVSVWVFILGHTDQGSIWGTQRTCSPFALSRSRTCIFKASSEVTKDTHWLLVNFQCVSPGSLPTARDRLAAKRASTFTGHSAVQSGVFCDM